jgi:hypothetical protein
VCERERERDPWQALYLIIIILTAAHKPSGHPSSIVTRLKASSFNLFVWWVGVFTVNSALDYYYNTLSFLSCMFSVICMN